MIRHTGKWTIRLGMLALVTFALLLSLLRLGMYNLHSNSDLVQSTLASELPGISFDGAHGSMNRLNPVLTVDNAIFRLPGSKLEIKLDGVAIEMSLWRSLLAMSPVVRKVHGGIDGLQLRRHVSGNWLINDYPIRFGSSEGNALSFQRAIQLLPEYLDLNFQNVEVVDEIESQHHRLETITAFLRQDNRAFEIEVGASLPDSLGNGLLLKGRISEDNSLLHAQLSGLQLSSLASLIPFDSDWSGEGQLSGVTWLEFDGRQLREASGRLQLDNARLQFQNAEPVEMDYRGVFRVAKNESEWLISNQVENLALNQQALYAFNTELSIRADNGRTMVAAWFDRMNLENAVALQPWLASNELGQRLVAASPTGLLQDVVVRLDSEQPADALVSSSFMSLTSQRVGKIPGVENLHGSFTALQGKVDVQLQGQSARLDFGDFFTETMVLQDYQLQAFANVSADGAVVVSVPRVALANQDAVVEARVWLAIDDFSYPFLYARAEVLEGRGNRVTPYLPARKIGGGVMRWLERALQDGEIVNADLLFHGRLNGISQWAANRSGEMQIEGQVEQVRLNFDPRWPVLEQATGRVEFHNMGVSGKLDQFVFGDTVNPRSAGFRINDYSLPWLDLELEADLPAEQLVAAWLEIPLSAPQRNAFSQFSGFRGQVDSNLSVRIPLKSGLGDEQVDLKMSLQDVGAESASLGIELSSLRGVLSIDRTSIAAEEIKGRFFDDDVTMSLKPDRQAKTTELTVNGRLSSANLVRTLPVEMQTRVSGKSDWRLALLFPMTSGGPTDPDLQVVARSDLQGTAIDLPRPLGISAASQHEFVSRVQLFSEHLQYSVGVGNRARFRGVLRKQGDGFKSQAADIALHRGFRGGMQRGLRIYGKLPEFAIREWIGIISAHSTGNEDFLQLVDVDIDNADLFGYQLTDVVFSLQRDGNRLNGTIESPGVSGVFALPSGDQAGAPIVVELDQLILTDRDTVQDGVAANPSTIPNLEISARRLDFRGKQFNNVKLSVRQTGNGIKIERANATQGKVQISSAATWTYDATLDRHQSLVSLSLRGSEFGQTLKTLDFGNVISGGTVAFDGDFEWSAALTDFDWESFSGAANLTIRDGVLNNVEPGAGGRLVGLLSISALPRRLSLDFKDMLVEGMEFEKISGSFRVSGEDLVTRNTRLRGPTADIRITGTTGILRRDYDQVMVVKPKLSASLPLIGTITAGSGIGWGLLLLHDLYKDAVNEAVEVEYRVKGSWDDPQITEIEEPTVEIQSGPNNDQNWR